MIPATPANVGVFQAACVAVLAGAYHVGTADALAYGIVLQAVEVATAVIMGTPALVNEGLSWKDVRLRTMHASPVKLAAAAGSRATCALSCAAIDDSGARRCGRVPGERRNHVAQRRIEIDERRLGIHVALSRRFALHGLDQ